MIPLSDDTDKRHFPLITIGLIAANLYVFFGWQTGVGVDQSVMLAGFVPRALTRHADGGVLHLFTAMFMHGGVMHLLGNMLFLWVFGKTAEGDTGAVRFFAFYVLTGVLAALAHTAREPLSRMPMVGASGAISGVLGGYLVKHPGAAIRTLLPLGIFSTVIEVPAVIFLLIWFAIQFLSDSATRGHPGGGVAYLAHIGGFLAGAVLIFFFQGNDGSRTRGEE